MGGHSGKAMNFVYAQAAKDATMAHFINKNLGRGTSFLHLNGAYHSNNDEGIIWYLKRLNDDLKIVTIASCEQNKIDKLEEENYQLADFIICIPADMTKTH